MGLASDKSLKEPVTETEPVTYPGQGRRSSGSMLVLICTYNERENLPLLLPKIAEAVPGVDVLIVDDGSPDGTSQWVREQQQNLQLLQPSRNTGVQKGDCVPESSRLGNLVLIEREGKLGLGSAIQAGMRYAIDHHYEWLLNLDGDMSHDPAVIPEMIQRRDEVDLVIGSRYVPGGGLAGCSWRRVLVSRAANTLARWIVGWKIGDCSSAYRMYRVSILQQVHLSQLRERGYGFLEEILAHVLKIGGRVVEVPIVYHERRLGKSKISLQEARSAFAALVRASRLRRSIRR